LYTACRNDSYPALECLFYPQKSQCKHLVSNLRRPGAGVMGHFISAALTAGLVLHHFKLCIFKPMFEKYMQI